VAARIKGIQFTLSSSTQDYESIGLPANYFQGFLQAIQQPKYSPITSKKDSHEFTQLIDK